MKIKNSEKRKDPLDQLIEAADSEILGELIHFCRIDRVVKIESKVQ